MFRIGVMVRIRVRVRVRRSARIRSRMMVRRKVRYWVQIGSKSGPNWVQIGSPNGPKNLPKCHPLKNVHPYFEHVSENGVDLGHVLAKKQILAERH